MAKLLGGILDPAARRRGFAQASLLADWAMIAGHVLAQRCQPIRVDYAPGRRSGGTLLLQVTGAAALEVQHAAPQLVERINGYFGHRAVRQLRLLQMPFARMAPPLPPPHRILAPREEAALAAAVTEVTDAPLQAALLALGRTVCGSRR